MKNIALNKKAYQSSYWKNNLYGPEQAVNGLKTGIGFHTNNEISPWWSVDLSNIYLLQKIVVYNCTTSHAFRSWTFVIKVSTNLSLNNWTTVHKQDKEPFGGIESEPAVINLNKVKARFVKFELESRTFLKIKKKLFFFNSKDFFLIEDAKVSFAYDNYLHLDEIEIYGIKPDL